MRVLDPDGNVLAEHPTRIVTAHGVIAARDEDGREVIRVADTASGPRPDGRGGYAPWYARATAAS